MNNTSTNTGTDSTIIAFFSSAAGLIILNFLGSLSVVLVYLTRKCMKISYKDGKLTIPSVSTSPLGFSEPETPPVKKSNEEPKNKNAAEEQLTIEIDHSNKDKK